VKEAKECFGMSKKRSIKLRALTWQRTESQNRHLPGVRNAAVLVSGFCSLDNSVTANESQKEKGDKKKRKEKIKKRPRKDHKRSGHTAGAAEKFVSYSNRETRKGSRWESGEKNHKSEPTKK